MEWPQSLDKAMMAGKGTESRYMTECGGGGLSKHIGPKARLTAGRLWRE